MADNLSQRALEIGANVERFVRDIVIPYEKDPRRDHHGAPLDALVYEMRDKARAAGVLTPHVLADGSHLTQLETAYVLQKSAKNSSCNYTAICIAVSNGSRQSGNRKGN